MTFESFHRFLITIVTPPFSCRVVFAPSSTGKPVHRLSLKQIICNSLAARRHHHVYIGEKKHGGLKMTDFNIMNKALKVAWMPRLQTNTDASWKIIPEIALEYHGGLSFRTHCNYDINSLQLNRLPGFYHEVLKRWQPGRAQNRPFRTTHLYTTK